MQNCSAFIQFLCYLIQRENSALVHVENRWFNTYSFSIKYHVQLWNYFQLDFVNVNSSGVKIKVINGQIMTNLKFGSFLEVSKKYKF